MPLPTDIRVREIDLKMTQVPYRTALKFGGVPTTHATAAEVM